MDPTTTPALYLTRPELIEGLRGCGQSAEAWDEEGLADLLAHASAERLSPAALAALASARHRLEVAAQALRELDRAQLALADALEAPQL
jgi:hypothetical protein